MLKLIFALTALAASAGACGPASAQAQPQAQTASGSSQQQPRANPDEIICHKQEVTGSRLGIKRVCKTRAEWADFQLQERQTIENYQTKRGMKGY
jgi:hypothetical protein